LVRIADSLFQQANSDLILGFPSAPFVLALRPDDISKFRGYLSEQGSEVQVDIRFATRRDFTGDWLIVPADGSHRFQPQFTLPDLLADWLLDGDGAAGHRARDVKKGLL